MQYEQCDKLAKKYIDFGKEYCTTLDEERTNGIIDRLKSLFTNDFNQVHNNKIKTNTTTVIAIANNFVFVSTNLDQLFVRLNNMYSYELRDNQTDINGFKYTPVKIEQLEITFDETFNMIEKSTISTSSVFSINNKIPYDEFMIILDILDMQKIEQAQILV